MKKINLFFLLISVSWSVNSQDISWTDIVVSQPEGFNIEANGNIRINTEEGLAWLISTVNGLNGQDANDYENLVVTLENDIDISANKWVAIGTQDNPFRGTFDGQGFSINGIYMLDAWEGRNFGLFGRLDNATVRNVVLGEGIVAGYEDCGGIAYLSENNTHIDKCVVKAQISFFNNGGGIVSTNKDSKISNCAIIPENVGVDGSFNGGIAGQNISANTNAIIENCYAVSLFQASYSSYYPGGIVGKNSTENESSGKAIVRNCYAVPLNLHAEYCGGIAGYNSENSLIENSYTNNSSYYEICGDNHGEIVNCSIFDEDLQLIENVDVFNKTTNELLEALNIWVTESIENQYLTWIIVDNETNRGFPIFGETTYIHDIMNNDIVMYPNPADDFIKIESCKNSEIKIYSINGQLVMQQNINEGVSKVDISDLVSGIYFIEMNDVKRKMVIK